MKMKQNFLITLIIVAFLVALAYGITGLIGTYKLSNGCLLRYSSTSALSKDKTSVDIREFALRADGNYTYKEFTETEVDSNGNLKTVKKYGPDPTKYGSWYKVDAQLIKNQKVSITVAGEISLCRAYIPNHNIQQVSNLDNTNKRIPIPRIDEATEGVPLILNAKSGEWRNVAETFQNDKLYVYLGVNHLPKKNAGGVIISDVDNILQFNRFTNANITADCREGKTAYDPICGRYTPYSGNYLSSCNMNGCAQQCYKCVWYWDHKYEDPAGKERNYHCDNATHGDNAAVPTAGFKRSEQYCCLYGTKTFSALPSYNHPTNVAPRKTTFSQLMNFDMKFNSATNCTTSGGQHGYVNSSVYQDVNTIWFTANDGAGLVYRHNNSVNPSDKASLGSTYSFANIPSTTIGTEKYKLVYEAHITSASNPYLQFRVVNSQFVPANQSTGGYVLYLKHTKCRRENGGALTDSGFNQRGRVKYLLLNGSNQNPNTDSSLNNSAVSIGFDADGYFQLPAESEGYLWLKIDNKTDDYKESFGAYNTQVKIETPVASGGISLFTGIFELFKTKMVGLSKTFLKNMTCYGNADKNCTNYFTYLRAMLILYITSIGFMFLLGMVELNQKELVIIVVKVAIISGLINEKTYDYIDSYFIPLITQAADTIIGNLEGMALFSKTTIVDNTKVVNPFTFVDELFSRIFLDPTFSAQFVALFSFGSHGIIYFVILAITLGIAVIAIFKAVTTYIMAFVAQCLLIMLAPFFLTFMLFDYTFPLFEKWLRYFIRYALEPIIVIVGLIVFVQLFTIYLDYTLNYSVCWKCAISFTIPFSKIPGLENLALTKVPLFCIYWFAPWGHDPAGAIMDPTSVATSINFTNVVALLIIAYGMNGYIDLVSGLVSHLANVEAPAASEAGQAMASSIGNTILKKVGLDKVSRDEMQKRIQQSKNKAQSEAGNSLQEEDKDTDKDIDNDSGNNNNAKKEDLNNKGTDNGDNNQSDVSENNSSDQAESNNNAEGNSSETEADHKWKKAVPSKRASIPSENLAENLDKPTEHSNSSKTEINDKTSNNVKPESDAKLEKDQEKNISKDKPSKDEDPKK